MNRKVMCTNRAYCVCHVDGKNFESRYFDNLILVHLGTMGGDTNTCETGRTDN